MRIILNVLDNYKYFNGYKTIQENKKSTREQSQVI